MPPNISLTRRIIHLATKLCMTPTDRCCMEVSNITGVKRWWLIGCVEGDVALPSTGQAKDIYEALSAAEEWLRRYN